MGRVPLHAATVALAPPPPPHFHRRAAAMVDGLARAQGRPTAGRGIGAAAALEVVRTHAVQRLGTALGELHLARTCDRSAVLELGAPSPTLVLVLRALRHGGEPTPRVAPLRPSVVSSLRELAQLRREQLDRRAPAGRPLTADVVVVAQAPGHVRCIAPVAHRLEVHHHRTVEVLSAKRSVVAAAAAAELAVTGPGAVPWRHVRTARSLAGAVRGAAPPAAPDVGSDAVAWWLAARICARVVERDLPAALTVADAVARWAADGGAGLLVPVNPYTSWGRAAATVARASGIAVASVEHGSILPEDPRWERCPVDRLCAWGAPSARALASSGFPGEVVVTGSPQHDASPDPGERLGLGPHVLIATSGAGDRVSLGQHLAFVDLLGAAVRAAPDLRWVVKLHPKDRRALYADLEPCGVQVLGGDGQPGPPIARCLLESQALVTVTSTSCLDALRAGVPVVVVEAAGSRDAVEVEYLARSAAVPPVATAAELVTAVRAVLDDPSGGDPTYLGEHFAHLGEATARTAAGLDELVHSGGRR